MKEVDFTRHVALLAFVDEPESQLGVGDQGWGVGTALLKHLVAIARDLGLREFRAEVLTENRTMLDVFSHSGLLMRQTISSGIAEVYLSLGTDRLSG